MKKGDKLRITEKRYHVSEQGKVTIGEIISIDEHKITIIKFRGTEKTFKESFNVGDLVCKDKKIEINENDGTGWHNFKLKVKEGGESAFYKEFKSNNQ